MARADEVWAELSVIVGCTSPDGDAELGQVKFLRDRVVWLEGILNDVQSASMGECNCVDEHDTCVWCVLQEWRECG